MSTIIVDQRIEDTDFRVEPWISDKINTRIRNSLQRAGIHTMFELAQRTRADVEDVPGIGIVCFVAIEKKLKKMKLSLKKTRIP